MKLVRFPNHEVVALQASSWIVKIDRGLSAKEGKQLTDWLEESPTHGESLVKYASMWDMLDVLAPMANLLPVESFGEERETDAQAPNQRLSQNNTWRPAYAIAASVIVMLGALLLLPTSFQEPISPVNTASNYDDALGVETVIHKTEVGESISLTLSDGSELKLNTDTEIAVQYSLAERKVELVKGEVYFEIAKNPQRPFIAVTADSNVTAVGTAFNIELSELGGTEVLVTEGKVRVDNFSNLDNSDGSSSAEVFLSKGQKAQIRAKKAEVSSQIDVDSALAWREGMILFSGETLDQVVYEIGRYTPLDFVILDKEIAAVQVGGYFKTGDMPQLLMILEQNFGIYSQRQGNQIQLSKRP